MCSEIALLSASGSLNTVVRSGWFVSTIALIFSGGHVRYGVPIRSDGLRIMMGCTFGGISGS